MIADPTASLAPRLASPSTALLDLPLDPLPERQQLVAVLMATSILLLVVELVRRRKLREEYSWVWVAVSIVLLALALVDGAVDWISAAIGSATATSTLFFSAIVFLLLLALQFSVRLSRLTHRQRTMAQRLALLEEEVRRLQAGKPEPARTEPTNGHEDVRPMHPHPRVPAGGDRREESA